jgi:hypothetical protein
MKRDRPLIVLSACLVLVVIAFGVWWEVQRWTCPHADRIDALERRIEVLEAAPAPEPLDLTEKRGKVR